MNKDEAQGKMFLEATKAGISFTGAKILPMSWEKQAELDAYTKKTETKDDDNAWKSACCYYSAMLNLETIAGRVKANDEQPEEFFFQAFKAGAITEKSAFVESYLKLAKLFGVDVKDFGSMYFDDPGGKAKACALIATGTPLMLYLGRKKELFHVIAGRGVVGNDEWLMVVDPGGKGDTFVRLSDMRTGHFANGKFVGSYNSDGTPRMAYKFGWFVKAG